MYIHVTLLFTVIGNSKLLLQGSKEQDISDLVRMDSNLLGQIKSFDNALLVYGHFHHKMTDSVSCFCVSWRMFL